LLFVRHYLRPVLSNRVGRLDKSCSLSALNCCFSASRASRC